MEGKVSEHFHAANGSEPPQLTTVNGLKNEIYSAATRYFAPVMAIAREFSTTAGIATTWWQSGDRKPDRTRKRGE